MKSIIFLALMAVMLRTVKSKNLEERFTEWVKRFEIRVENDEHRTHMFRNWMQNDEYIEDIWPPGAHIITIIPIATDWLSMNKLVTIPTIGKSVTWIRSPTIELLEFVIKFLKLSILKSVPTPIIRSGIR